ncbi:MAG: hypothetical protein OXF93_06045 [Acidobacteria bacterium]|nr:hypothetical protein [Acidobacteriota bacterium]
MHYRVRARFRQQTAGAFRRALRDTIPRQQPDGEEIVDSMRRAVVTGDGTVEWSEVCFCPTPLEHERSTVYDRHFDDLTTETVEGYETRDGAPFLAHLDRLADSKG